MTLDALRLADFNDIDLLHVLDEVGDDEGWATAEEVARQIGVSHRNPSQCVGSRFAWLYRYGVMERRQSKHHTQWRLNVYGYALIFPDAFSKTLANALEKLEAGQIIALTDHIAKGLPQAPRQATHLARRAWRHHLDGWRDPEVSAGPK